MTRTCEHPGCDRPHKARGRCQQHYDQMRYSYEAGPGLAPAIDRLLAQAEFGQRRPDGSYCLMWTGTPNENGYGRRRLDGRRVYTHRWLYERWVGPIPEGLTLDHLCFTALCMNPAHLEPVTKAENTSRMRRRMAASTSTAGGPDCPPAA